jgi:1-acylglycerone phosphate reductase
MLTVPWAGYTTTLLDTDIDTAKKMFGVNVFGPLELIQACAPMLIAAKGQILNIGSVAGILQIPYQGMYNASKATMHVMTENLRLELAPFGVRVLLVLTGGIRTNFFNNVDGDILPKHSVYQPAAAEVLPHLTGGRERRLEGCK